MSEMPRDIKVNFSGYIPFIYFQTPHRYVINFIDNILIYLRLYLYVFNMHDKKLNMYLHIQYGVMHYGVMLAIKRVLINASVISQ